MFWVLTITIAIGASIVVQPGYTIHSYYRTTATRNCCAPVFTVLRRAIPKKKIKRGGGHFRLLFVVE